jgi:two-component sensor histidine kinase
MSEGSSAVGSTSGAAPRRELSLRRRMILVMAAAAVPGVALAGVLLGLGATQQRTLSERAIEDAVNAAAVAVEQQVAAWTAAVDAMATAPSLRAAEFERFYGYAADVGAQYGGWMILFDPSGQQLINTLLPYGAPLPRAPDPAQIARLLATDDVQVGDAYFGAVAERWLLPVDRRVEAEDGRRFLLTLAVEPAEVTRTLRRVAWGLPQDWALWVYDSQLRIVAGNGGPGPAAGEPAEVSSVDLANGLGTRLVTTDTPDGPYVSAFRRIEGAPWTARVGAPAAAVRAAERQFAIQWGLLALTALGSAVALAYVFARQITAPLVDLAAASGALARGEDVPLERPAVREIEALRRTLANAGRAAREATVARERAAAAEALAEQLRAGERRQRLLAGELSHRVKNTLATVQSIFNQTMRAAPDLATARDTIEGRLIALANAHDLLTRSQWAPASLADIVGATASVLDGDQARMRILGGPAVRLAPPAALALALALHELGTNALKYGALSAPSGVVELGWTLRGDRVALTWRERGGPPVTPPQRQGFGTRFISRALAADAAGSATLDFAPEGLICTIEMALDAAAAAEDAAARRDAPAPPRPGV